MLAGHGLLQPHCNPIQAGGWPGFITNRIHRECLPGCHVGPGNPLRHRRRPHWAPADNRNLRRIVCPAGGTEPAWAALPEPSDRAGPGGRAGHPALLQRHADGCCGHGRLSRLWRIGGPGRECRLPAGRGVLWNRAGPLRALLSVEEQLRWAWLGGSLSLRRAVHRTRKTC